MEEWKYIKNYEGVYQASNLGRIQSVDRKICCNRYMKGRILTLDLRKGYFYSTLCQNGKCKSFITSRLVAQTFLPNPNNLPCVNHKNGIKTDNRIENLEWCSYIENNRHAIDTNLYKTKVLKGENNITSKLKAEQILEIRNREKIGWGFYEKLGREFGVTGANISSIYNRKSWKHI